MYSRKRGLCLLGVCFLCFVNIPLKAQQREGGELIPSLTNQAVVLDINARVLEQNQRVVWNEAHQRVTIPGRAVGMKLVGTNVAVAVQFTPYLRVNEQQLLVAQAQIWAEVPKQGIRYQTSIKTIPLDFDEPVYFFPLGSVVTEDSPRIEIRITLKHHKDSADSEAGTPANARRNGP